MSNFGKIIHEGSWSFQDMILKNPEAIGLKGGGFEADVHEAVREIFAAREQKIKNAFIAALRGAGFKKKDGTDITTEDLVKLVQILQGNGVQTSTVEKINEY